MFKWGYVPSNSSWHSWGLAVFGEVGFFSSVVGAWGSGISSLELGCPVPPRLCPGTPMVPAGFSSGLWVCSLSLSSYTTVGPCCAHIVSGWPWCQTSCSYKFIFSLNKIKKIPDIPDCRAPWLRLPLFINCNSSVSSPPSNLSVSQNIWTARGGRCTPTSWRVSTGCGSRGLRAPTPSWPMRWVWARRCRPPSSFTRCIKRWVAVRSWILLYPCGAAHAEAVTLYLLLWLESFGSSSSPPFCWKFELLLELDLNSFTYVIFISFFCWI